MSAKLREFHKSNPETTPSRSKCRLPWLYTLWRPKPAKKHSTSLNSPAAHLVRGKWAEQAACTYLVSQGLTVFERNFSAKCGELDLIMRFGSQAVIVEVRQRSQASRGPAIASIAKSKQQKLKRCAALWWQAKGRFQFESLRFDVVGIDGPPGQHEITWIKNAIGF